MQAVVVPGDPTEELLYQSRAQQADLIVLGAQGASAFAAITRHGVVYKLLAHSHVPGDDAFARGAGAVRSHRRTDYRGGYVSRGRFLGSRRCRFKRGASAPRFFVRYGLALGIGGLAFARESAPQFFAPHNSPVMPFPSVMV